MLIRFGRTLSLKLLILTELNFPRAELTFDAAHYYYALPDIDCAGGIVGKKECVVQTFRRDRNKRDFLSLNRH
jgi:hypothetical protein